MEVLISIFLVLQYVLFYVVLITNFLIPLVKSYFGQFSCVYIKDFLISSINFLIRFSESFNCIFLVLKYALFYFVPITNFVVPLLKSYFGQLSTVSITNFLISLNNFLIQFSGSFNWIFFWFLIDN